MCAMMLYHKFNKTPAGSGQAGFTLIEVLASILIFGILTVGIASTMRQTSKLTKKLKSRGESVFSGQVVMDRMQKDLQMAFDERVQKSASFFKSREVSSGPELTFTFLDSEFKIVFEERTAGMKIVRYYLEKSDNGSLNLMRMEAPYYLNDKIEDQRPQLVGMGVLNWKMEYYDGRADIWQREWDTTNASSSNRFPRAVRISLQTVDTRLPQEEWKEKSLTFSTDLIVLNEVELR